jgi:transcriptional regulator with XRE-family HTH domain
MSDLSMARIAEWPFQAVGTGCMTVDVKQIKAARELLGWSQVDLGNISKVSISTIKLLESKEGPLGGQPETRARILVALEKAGIEFSGNGLGVRLVPKTRRRQKDR